MQSGYTRSLSFLLTWWGQKCSLRCAILFFFDPRSSHLLSPGVSLPPSTSSTKWPYLWWISPSALPLATQHPTSSSTFMKFCPTWVLGGGSLQLRYGPMTQVLCHRHLTFLDKIKDDLSLQPAQHLSRGRSLYVLFSQWVNECWNKMSRTVFLMTLKWQTFHSWSWKPVRPNGLCCPPNTFP